MARLHVMERSHAQAVMDDLHDALGRRLAVSSLAPCPVEFTAALVRMCSTQSCGKCTAYGRDDLLFERLRHRLRGGRDGPYRHSWFP